MASNLPLNTAYGLSQALINVFPTPIVSTRDPQASDRAQLGTIWVNKTTNDGFVLTSVVAGASTWIVIGGGTGTFSSLTVNPGNITATAGNIIASAGNIQATAGSVSAGTTVTAGTGITSTTGNIVATAGAVNAGTTMTAGTGITATSGGVTATAGDITATAGDIVATAGDIIAVAGDIEAVAGSLSAGTTVTAGTGITATTGNITASAGNIIATVGSITAATAVSGRDIVATGDSGTGFATFTSMTNVVDTTQGAGTLSILSSSANPGNNAGFLKFYVGLTAVYVPYFTNIAP